MPKIKSFIILCVIGVAFDSLICERYWVRFPEYIYYSDRIPKEFDGFRIAIVSDLHYGFLDPDTWIKFVIMRINSQNSDLIVGLGDYVKKRKTDLELINVWPLLLTLKAKYGVFFINGNHDHWANSKLSLKLLNESEKSVRHSHKKIYKNGSKIVIGGTGDYWEDEVGIDKALIGLEEKEFVIILTHNPDATNTKHTKRVDLFLSGHTHGGQVRIPILEKSPILPVKNYNFDKGFKKNRYGEDLFISAGIGWSIIPVRFYCPSEVPIIILKNVP